MLLHLSNDYLHEEIQSSSTGDSHTAASATYPLDIAYRAEPERCVDDAKIMPPKPTKETTDTRWYSGHSLIAWDTVYTGIALLFVNNRLIRKVVVRCQDYFGQAAAAVGNLTVNVTPLFVFSAEMTPLWPSAIRRAT